jgi:cyclase
VFTHNATRDANVDVGAFAKQMTDLGAGEILVNSIDRDGCLQGYDLTLIQIVRDAVQCPVTALGGAGSLKDIGELIAKFEIIGASAGSLFVFKGVYRAVLINYPNRADRDALVQSALSDRNGRISQ